MVVENGDNVIYVDPKREGEDEIEGEVVGVNKTMFGDETYNVDLGEKGFVSGVGEDQLKLVDE